MDLSDCQKHGAVVNSYIRREHGIIFISRKNIVWKTNGHGVTNTVT